MLLLLEPAAVVGQDCSKCWKEQLTRYCTRHPPKAVFRVLGLCCVPVLDHVRILSFPAAKAELPRISASSAGVAMPVQHNGRESCGFCWDCVLKSCSREVVLLAPELCRLLLALPLFHADRDRSWNKSLLHPECWDFMLPGCAGGTSLSLSHVPAEPKTTKSPED